MATNDQNATGGQSPQPVDLARLLEQSPIRVRQELEMAAVQVADVKELAPAPLALLTPFLRVPVVFPGDAVIVVVAGNRVVAFTRPRRRLPVDPSMGEVRDALEQLQGQVGPLRLDLAGLVERLAEAEQRATAVQGGLEQLRGQLGEGLDGMHQDLTAARADLDQTSATLEGAVDGLRQQLTGIQGGLDEVRHTAATLGDRIDHLEDPGPGQPAAAVAQEPAPRRRGPTARRPARAPGTSGAEDEDAATREAEAPAAQEKTSRRRGRRTGGGNGDR
jgi:hypothetical protein